jgi:hypothetical protein
MNELRSEPAARVTLMKFDDITILMALLIVTLMTVHLGEDVVYRYEPAGLAILVAVPVVAIWLYATLALAGRRSGYILLLLGSFFAAIIPVIHLSGRGVRDEVVQSSGGLLFIWILLALAMSASIGCVLSIHGLWRTKQSMIGFVLWTFVALAAGGALFGYLVFSPK